MIAVENSLRLCRVTWATQRGQKVSRITPPDVFKSRRLHEPIETEIHALYTRVTLFKFVSQSFAPAFFMQFGTLFSNIASIIENSEKNDVARGLKVNFGSFRHTVRCLVS